MSREEASLETVDWAEVRADGPRLPTGSALVLPFVALVTLFGYHSAFVPPGEKLVNEAIFGFRVRLDPTGFDWLVALSVLVFAVVVVLPLVRTPALARRAWRDLRGDPLALASFAYLVVFVVGGALGPALLGDPTIDPAVEFQPPVYTTVESTTVLECVGRTSVDGSLCHGSWQYPLGTDNLGRSMLHRLVQGLQVSLLMALVASMLMVPIAVTVGTLAGYLGGTVDDLLMRYVDIQQTVPAILVYLVAVYLLRRSLFLVVLVFGLLSWGGIARVVRSEVRQRKRESYVRAARAAGAGRLRVVRDHLLPNVSNTVLTAVTIQVPTLLLAEASLGYLGLGERYSKSLGQLVRLGTTEFDFTQVPWVATEAALALALTAVAFNLFGDALRGALDPRDS
jgi:peptide/nickel transport system permease protein